MAIHEKQNKITYVLGVNVLLAKAYLELLVTLLILLVTGVTKSDPADDSNLRCFTVFVMESMKKKIQRG